MGKLCATFLTLFAVTAITAAADPKPDNQRLRAKHKIRDLRLIEGKLYEFGYYRAKQGSPFTISALIFFKYDDTSVRKYLDAAGTSTVLVRNIRWNQNMDGRRADTGGFKIRAVKVITDLEKNYRDNTFVTRDAAGRVTGSVDVKLEQPGFVVETWDAGTVYSGDVSNFDSYQILTHRGLVKRVLK